MFRAIIFLIKLPFTLAAAIWLSFMTMFTLFHTIPKEKAEAMAATSKAPHFFRNLRDPIGNLTIPNIETLSDEDIVGTYKHIDECLRMQALVRKEKISDRFISGVVRDCLIVYAKSGFDQGFEYSTRVLDAYTARGEEAVKIKGRNYG
jgi:hypothetical protein